METIFEKVSGMRYFILIMLLVGVLACKVEPRRPIVVKSSSIQQSVQINKQQNKKEELLIRQFIQKDSLTTYHNSKKGFWYAYTLLKKKQKYTAKTNDIVIFASQVEGISGKIIYSFETVGRKKYRVDKQNIIKGLQEGLKLMKEGEECTFLFPSYKAYGYVGDGNKIGRNQPLIYKVKLIKIIKFNQK